MTIICVSDYFGWILFFSMPVAGLGEKKFIFDHYLLIEYFFFGVSDCPESPTRESSLEKSFWILGVGKEEIRILMQYKHLI